MAIKSCATQALTRTPERAKKGMCLQFQALAFVKEGLPPLQWRHYFSIVAVVVTEGQSILAVPYVLIWQSGSSSFWSGYSQDAGKEVKIGPLQFLCIATIFT